MPPIPSIALPFLDEIVALRRDIHAHPELAYQETRTSDIVAKTLSACGLEVHRGLGGTGVVGVLKKGGGERAIGLRADMDALPIEERNNFSHRSTHAGKMHACGHDGHTATLLGAARYLAENRETLDIDGTVYFIFQPAEESEGGAERMIQDGLFKRFPMEAVYGLHNWPGIPLGRMAVMAGPVMAGTCAFEIRLRGTGCHAAMPHQGHDAIVAASQLVLAMQTVVSRNLHPCEAAVLSVTQIHAGDALNVIPDEVVLRGTIRSFKPAVQSAVEAAMRRLCEGIGKSHEVAVSIGFEHRYPPTVNDAGATAMCHRVAQRVFGAEQVLCDELPSMGAEDFAYMLREKPGCYVWLGNGTADSSIGGCTLHNPNYDFNDEIIPLGIAYWTELVQSALQKE